MPMLLVFEEEAATGHAWSRRLQNRSAGWGVKIQQAATLELLQSALNERSADVILVDVTGAGASRVEFVTAARAQHPELRTLVVVEARMISSAALQELLTSPLVDFVRAPVDVDEAWQRIRRLVGTDPAAADPRYAGVPTDPPSRRRARAARPKGTRASPSAAPAACELTRHLMPDLRSPSGRLDAKRVAALFGLRLTEVARILGRPLSPVHKTPDAPALQPRLALFERIAAALRPLAGSDEGMRMWLNAPNPDLEGHLPLELLQRGQGEIVAELLEDGLVGQPG